MVFLFVCIPGCMYCKKTCTVGCNARCIFKRKEKAYNVYHHCNVLTICTIFVTKPIGLQ